VRRRRFTYPSITLRRVTPVFVHVWAGERIYTRDGVPTRSTSPTHQRCRARPSRRAHQRRHCSRKTRRAGSREPRAMWSAMGHADTRRCVRAGCTRAVVFPASSRSRSCSGAGTPRMRTDVISASMRR
jgi:hypothetical protein